MLRYSRRLTVFILIVIVIISIFLIREMRRNYFSEFTVEKWDKYVKMRHLMIKDMIWKVDLESLTLNNIDQFLGCNGLLMQDNEYLYLINGDPVLRQFYIIHFKDDGTFKSSGIFNDFSKTYPDISNSS